MENTLSYERGIPASEQYGAGPLAGLTVSRTHDAALRLDSLSVTHGGEAIYQAGYGYTVPGGGAEAGRLRTVNFGGLSFRYGYHANENLVAALESVRDGTPVMTTRQTYDTANRLKEIRSVKGAVGEVISAYRYGHNLLGQRVRAELAGGERWRKFTGPASDRPYCPKLCNDGSLGQEMPPDPNGPTTLLWALTSRSVRGFRRPECPKSASLRPDLRSKCPD